MIMNAMDSISGILDQKNIQDALADLQYKLDEYNLLRQHYNELSHENQIELDLLTTFTVNALYWIYLRLTGVDVMNHPIKEELNRIKAAIKEWKMIKDRELRPKIDKAAAKRFIKNGLWDPTQSLPTLNKKKKFNDD